MIPFVSVLTTTGGARRRYAGGESSRARSLETGRGVDGLPNGGCRGSKLKMETKRESGREGEEEGIQYGGLIGDEGREILRRIEVSVGWHGSLINPQPNPSCRCPSSLRSATENILRTLLSTSTGGTMLIPLPLMSGLQDDC